MENKETMIEKKTWILSVHRMKVNYERVIELNNELRVNVDEQQDDTKHLKEQCDLDDDDEVQEITASITPSKRKPQCVWHVILHLQLKIG